MNNRKLYLFLVSERLARERTRMSLRPGLAVNHISPTFSQDSRMTGSSLSPTSASGPSLVCAYARVRLCVVCACV